MNAQYQREDKVKCQINSWTMGKSKEKGTPYVRINLSNRITWTGWLTPKTEQNTIETLGELGFKGSNLRMLTEDDALDTNINVIATIDTFRDYEGKRYYDAKWLNKEWTKGFNKKAFKGDLDDFNFDTSGYIEGAKDISPPAAISPEFNNSDGGFSEDDIPF